MEDFINYIKNYIDTVLETTNGVALSIMIDMDKMEGIGLLNSENKQSMEKTRTENMAVYNFCQDLYKKVVQYEHLIESGENKNGKD